MNLIIFIGHHKTGSSSLQSFLAANAARLRREGILYPGIYHVDSVASFAARLQRGFIPLLQNPKAQISSMLLNRREPHSALVRRMRFEYRGETGSVPFNGNVPSSGEIFEAIHSQVKRHKIHTVILCSEMFSGFGKKSQAFIERIRSEFNNCDTRILCTLRRVDEHVSSWYGQRIKFGQKLEPLRESGTEQILNTVHVDYKSFLSAWSDIFQGSEFIIRNYRDVLSNGGSIPDFIEYSGIEFPGQLRTVKNINPSIPASFFEICRQANLQLDPEKSRWLRKQVLKYTRAHSADICTDVELFGKSNRQQLYERFLPVNDYIYELTGNSSFFPDLDQILVERGIPELDAARRAKSDLLAFLAGRSVSRDVYSFLENF